MWLYMGAFLSKNYESPAAPHLTHISLLFPCFFLFSLMYVCLFPTRKCLLLYVRFLLNEKLMFEASDSVIFSAAMSSFHVSFSLLFPAFASAAEYYCSCLCLNVSCWISWVFSNIWALYFISFSDLNQHDRMF